MSDKTAEERQMEKEQELAQKMILGEIKPDLVQSYRIIKNCIDAAIQKGIYSAADNALLVRAFDTLRDHINEQISVEKKAEHKTEKEASNKEEVVDKTEEVVEEAPKKKRPPRKKR
jgi:site-specific DNA-adenine methylase